MAPGGGAGTVPNSRRQSAVRDSGQSAGLVKIKRAQISFKKSKNVCSSKKDIQLRQSKTRLSCEFQGSNGDADGYGFSRNDFNRHEQS